jgi:hypothetical protein
LNRKQDGFGEEKNLLLQPGLELRTAQPVASYTDYDIPALYNV